jgi:hypothetical protein
MQKMLGSTGEGLEGLRPESHAFRVPVTADLPWAMGRLFWGERRWFWQNKYLTIRRPSSFVIERERGRAWGSLSAVVPELWISNYRRWAGTGDQGACWATLDGLGWHLGQSLGH